MDNNRERVPRSVAPGQSCQVCGAETRSDEPLCDACAHTVDTIVDTPLPPIPDGGLSRAMPNWLRSSNGVAAEEAQSPQSTPNEFAEILSDEDIPVWLKRMAERHAAENAPPGNLTESPERAAPLVQTASPAPPAQAPAAQPERRVTVGAVPPVPRDPAPTSTRRAVETRTAIGVGILAAVAGLVILAIILFG